MLNLISKKIASKLFGKLSSQNEDTDAIALGLFIILSDLMYFGICILLGFLFNIVLEMMIFFISFLLLRRYAGGYHSDSETVCEVLSSLSLLICALIIKNFVFNTFSILVVAFFIICIIVFSPVCSENNPTSDEEKKRYKIISLIILAIIITVIILAYIFKMNTIFSSCATSLILEGILVIAGKIKSIIKKKS